MKSVADILFFLLEMVMLFSDRTKEYSYIKSKSQKIWILNFILDFEVFMLRIGCLN